MGYAGGVKPNPTYYDLGTHSETIQIDYDPTVITYEQLLDVFWQSHNPTAPSYSPQYASIIFYHDAEQQRMASASKAKEAERRGRAIQTEIRSFETFERAEDYHQKYELQQRRETVDLLKPSYPTIKEFVDSTIVARLNGYAGRNVSRDELVRQLTDLGLETEIAEAMADSIR